MHEVELALHDSAWPDGEFVLSLAGVAAAGYRAIEVRSDVVPLYEDRVHVFQEMLAQQGVTLVAVETRLRPMTLDILEEEVERCANVARFLRANKAEILVLHPPERRSEGDEKDDMGLAIEAMSQIGKRTLDLDVRTCVHPEYGTIAESKRTVEKVLALTDARHVRVCADVGFLTAAGMSVLHFLRKYKSRVDYIHLRDIRKPRARKRRPARPEPAQFGKGAVGIEAVAKVIEGIDYSGWVTVEIPGPVDNPVEAALSAREITRRALGLL